MSKQDKVNEILGFIPSELATTVDLPSRGNFYRSGNHTATVKPLDFEGEKALLNVHKSRLDPVDLVISLCVEGIDIEELCVIDKLFLLTKVREVSHGSEVRTTFACPSCAHENSIAFDLGVLSVNYVPEDMKEPIEVHLPKINKQSEVRLLRVRDSKYIKTSEDILDNLWRFVLSIDGTTDEEIIAQVIRQLPSQDRKAIIEAVFGTEYGLETKIKVECEACERVNIIDLPIAEDFFTER